MENTERSLTKAEDYGKSMVCVSYCYSRKELKTEEVVCLGQEITGSFKAKLQIGMAKKRAIRIMMTHSENSLAIFLIPFLNT